MSTLGGAESARGRTPGCPREVPCDFNTETAEKLRDVAGYNASAALHELLRRRSQAGHPPVTSLSLHDLPCLRWPSMTFHDLP